MSSTWADAPAPSSGRPLKQGRKIITPIRAKYGDKPRDKVQPAKDKEISRLLATNLMAYYEGRSSIIRILCGAA
jgi:hypothetical protein